MGKRVFIAEKPELARAIVEGIEANTGQKALKKDGYYDANNDIVTYAFGHILTLFDPEDYDPTYKKWDMATLPMSFIPWKKKPIAGKEKQLKIILDLLKQADSIVNAGDPDEEGQLLVDEIIEYSNSKKPVLRLLINDNNTKVVQKALDNLEPNENYQGLMNSALARSVGDQLFGYNLSRAYTLAARAKGGDGVKSVGRVQTPVLGLIVRRDKAHESHKKQYYYSLSAEFTANAGKFIASYRPPKDMPSDEKGRVINEGALKEVEDACKGKQGTIETAETTAKKEAQPLPYNLLQLQAEANKKYGYTAAKVLEITQKLREDHRLISYNRSDCQYIKEENFADAPEVLAAILATATGLDDIVNGASPSIKSKAWNTKNVTAHGAIIPTAGVADFAKLSEDQQRIYTMIALRYLLQFYPEHEYLETKVTVNCEGHIYNATSRQTKISGWKTVFQPDKETDEDNDNQEDSGFNLSVLAQTDPAICTGTTLQRKETSPPPYFTEASLLMELTRMARHIKDPKIRKILEDKDKDKKGEHGGLGTPATRSTIIETLKSRGFITNKGKAIISTEEGRAFCAALPEEATVPDMTALWHSQQKDIAEGAKSVDEFLRGLMEYIGQQVDNLKTEGLNIAISLQECPVCKKGVLKQKQTADKKKFFGCTAYPECRATFPVSKKGGAEIGPECPVCKNGFLKRIKGQYGEFFACSNGECKAKFDAVKGKPDLSKKPGKKTEISNEFICPECGKGLIRRPDKKRENSFWWGCSGFTDGCRQIFSDKDGKPKFKEQ